MKNVTIYGLQRTGTNFVKWILDRNFLCCVKQYGRHYPFNSEDVKKRAQPLIITTKDVYSWLPSLYRWRKRCRKLAIKEGELVDGMSFDDFVRGPANPVKRWNVTNWHYLTADINGLPREVVRYEDVYEDPAKEMLRLGEALGLVLVKTKNHISLPEGRVTPANKDSNKAFDADYYREKQYLREYSPELLDFVRKRLDERVLERIGYDVNP